MLDECLQFSATNKHEKCEPSQQRDNGTTVCETIDRTLTTFIRTSGMRLRNEVRRQGIEYVRRQEVCGLVGEVNKVKRRRYIIIKIK
jgi:hypothetical protein